MLDSIFSDVLVKIKGGMEPDVGSFNSCLQKMQTADIEMGYSNIISSVINDDSGNVDFIGKKSMESELIIIDYIINKIQFFESLHRFFFKTEIFNRAEGLLRVYLESYEKLYISKLLREEENSIIKMSRGKVDKSEDHIRNYIFVLAVEFLKQQLSDNHKNFPSKYIYADVSNILKYFNELIEKLKNFLADSRFNTEYHKRAIICFVYICSKLLTTCEELHHNQVKVLGNDLSMFSSIASFDIINACNYVLQKAIEFNKELKIIDCYFENILFKLAEKILYVNSIIEFNSRQNYEKESLHIKRTVLERLHTINQENTLQLAFHFNDYHHVMLIAYKRNDFVLIKRKLNERMLSEFHINYLFRLALFIESKSYENKVLGESKVFELFENYEKQIEHEIAGNERLRLVFMTYRNASFKKQEIMEVEVSRDVRYDLRVKLRNVAQMISNIKNEFSNNTLETLNFLNIVDKINTNLVNNYCEIEELAYNLTKMENYGPCYNYIDIYRSAFNLILAKINLYGEQEQSTFFLKKILLERLIPLDSKLIYEIFRMEGGNLELKDTGDDFIRALRRKSILVDLLENNDDIADCLNELLANLNESDREEINKSEYARLYAHVINIRLLL